MTDADHTRTAAEEQDLLLKAAALIEGLEDDRDLTPYAAALVEGLAEPDPA